MELRGVEGYRRVYFYEFDARRHGGLGVHVLDGDPVGQDCLVVSGILEIKEALVGGGSLSLSLLRDGDILPATGAPAVASVGELVPCVPEPRPPFVILNTVQGALPVLNVLGAAFTAGRFVLALEAFG